MSRHSDEDGDGIADYAQAHPYLTPDTVIMVDPVPIGVVNGVVEDGSVPVPLKTPGQPMSYRRDVPRDATPDVFDATALHIRDHLASVISSTDDPDDLPAGLGPLTLRIVDDDPASDTVGLVGEIDAEPDAPYLRDDFDPDADDGSRFQRYSEAGRPGEPDERREP